MIVDPKINDLACVVALVMFGMQHWVPAVEDEVRLEVSMYFRYCPRM